MTSTSIGIVTVGPLQFVFKAPRMPTDNGVYLFDFQIEPQESLNRINDSTELERLLEANLPKIYAFINKYQSRVSGFNMKNYYAFWALFHDRPHGEGSHFCIKPLKLNNNEKPLDPCQYLTFVG